MRYCLRMVSIALLPWVAALAGCNVFETSEDTEPAVEPEHTVTKNPVAPPKPGPAEKPQTAAAQPAQPAKPAKPAKEPTESEAVKVFSKTITAAWGKVEASSDMSCVLVRKEIVGDTAHPEEVIEFKERFSPHALKLTWVGEQHKGREIVYVAGQNDNKVMVKEPGVLGRVAGAIKQLEFAPDSAEMRSQSRYTPDVVGYDLYIARVRMLFEDDRSSSLAWVSEAKPETAGERKLQKFEVTLQSQALNGRIKKMEITFDVGTGLPVHMVMHDPRGRVVEDYDWQNIKLGAGLKDEDFKLEAGK